ncbi:MAG: hypothetical protein NTW69_01205 [Chloroflexi bacterium]|nr:hypothetical protein [Chloroflexota bacterium]
MDERRDRTWRNSAAMPWLTRLRQANIEEPRDLDHQKSRRAAPSFL